MDWLKEPKDGFQIELNSMTDLFLKFEFILNKRHSPGALLAILLQKECVYLPIGISKSPCCIYLYKANSVYCVGIYGLVIFNLKIANWNGKQTFRFFFIPL